MHDSSPLTVAHQTLLEPAGLTMNTLQTVLDHLQGAAIDYADLYFQSSQGESWVLEDGIVKDAAYQMDRGAGIRAISGAKTGFAYSEDLQLSALQEAAGAARSIACIGAPANIQIGASKAVPHVFYPGHNPLKSLTEPQKIDLLRSLDTAARRMDPRITQVIISLSGLYETILVVATDGTLAADIRPLVRLNVSVVAESKGRRERGSSGGGGRFDYTNFLQQEQGLHYVRLAVEQALTNLNAVPAPAGMMPVVLGPGWPGVLLHEAVGHGLEGDFNRKGSSAFSGRIGELVASPLCTIVDDGTLDGRRGSLNIDDEGSCSQCTTLIEKGILKGYLLDKLNARLMGMQSTGNGRRESYAHVVLPRMTNTYMLPGQHEASEMIASVEQGLYAVQFGGGQVDITSGKFVFEASLAYLIEKGKITRPVKGATLIGNGAEVLKQITMVGNDLQLDTGVGVCGKEGQSVPVGVGQPTLKIAQMTVGGTQC